MNPPILIEVTGVSSDETYFLFLNKIVGFCKSNKGEGTVIRYTDGSEYIIKESSQEILDAIKRHIPNLIVIN